MEHNLVDAVVARLIVIGQLRRRMHNVVVLLNDRIEAVGHQSRSRDEKLDILASRRGNGATGATLAVTEDADGLMLDVGARLEVFHSGNGILGEVFGGAFVIHAIGSPYPTVVNAKHGVAAVAEVLGNLLVDRVAGHHAVAVLRIAAGDDDDGRRPSLSVGQGKRGTVVDGVGIVEGHIHRTNADSVNLGNPCRITVKKDCRKDDE